MSNNFLLITLLIVFLRFPIAIKYPTSNNLEKIDLFLEEAKTMLRIGSYHDYIVNLQGVTYGFNQETFQLNDVSICEI